MSTAHLGLKIRQVTYHFESKGQENTNCKVTAKLNQQLSRTIEKVTEMFWLQSFFLNKTLQSWFTFHMHF